MIFDEDKQSFDRVEALDTSTSEHVSDLQQIIIIIIITVLSQLFCLINSGNSLLQVLATISLSGLV